MSVLSAVQGATLRLGLARPAAVLSANDQLAMEMGDLANEAALDIARANDWQAITKHCALTGNEVVPGFAMDFSPVFALAEPGAGNFTLPSDFDRMLLNGHIRSSRWNAPLTPARSLDQWAELANGALGGIGWGTWILAAKRIYLAPIPDQADNLSFFYISRNIITAATGVVQERFLRDDDTFILPERLLTLSLIWRWRAQKGLEYAEHMRNYEIALAQEIGYERPRHVVPVGVRGRGMLDVRYCYPGTLGQ